MNYEKEFFDTYIQRRGTRSMKWDGCNERFGVDPSVEMLPMWVADMDFRSPDEVVEAVTERAQSGLFGYSTKPDSFYDAIISWVRRRYHWDIKKEWILFTPGVVPGFNAAFQAYTEKGDGIIIQSPVYYPFADGIRNNERHLVDNRLMERDGEYSVDWELLEKQVKDPANKLLLLCNPHNPIGKCWSPAELERMGNLCADNSVILVSDEIHADLIMKGAEHTAAASVSEKIRNNTITQYAPSKTFNLAGLQTSYAIIPDDRLRAQFQQTMTANRVFNVNYFGPIALETAYNRCESYVTALCEYVDANMDYMKQFLQDNLPFLKMRKPEGTYMVWVDFRESGMEWKEIEEFIVHKAHIGVDFGSWFGKAGRGFLRFNLACPRILVEQAMKQLQEAFAKTWIGGNYA